jgi:hypothetical protein
MNFFESEQDIFASLVTLNVIIHLIQIPGKNHKSLKVFVTRAIFLGLFAIYSFIENK